MVVEVNIGLIGLGTIGSGVIEILSKNNELIEKRTGVKINLLYVCDKSIERANQLGVENIFVSDYKKILDDKKVNTIVELIGGFEPAHTIIIDSIKAKKHIVTANKAVLAKYGYEIFEEAQKQKVNVLFEASVCGAIPIIKTIEESYASDNIESICGIINGTTNFILTKMSEGLDYDSALKQAQELGFAESNPEFDVEGKDAAQKLKILASLAFDAKIEEEPFTQGITKITNLDINYAKELGYKIKLLAIAKKDNNLIELKVHPTMIPHNHVLANINNEVNGVILFGKNTGQIFLSGKGAGKLPTATVIVTDLIEMGSRGKITQRKFEKRITKPITESHSRFFLRFTVTNKPNVLSQLTKILGNEGISIAAVSQKEINKEIIPVIFITHKAQEQQIINAISQCDKLEIIKEPTAIIRIEDLF